MNAPLSRSSVLLLVVLAAAASSSTARAEAPAPAWTHRAAIVSVETVAGVGAGVAGTLLTSAAILAIGLDSPFRSPLSFALLATVPALTAASGAWAAGLLEPGFSRQWWVAAVGAAMGAALAVAGVGYFFSTPGPSPGIELAYALGLLLGATPVLAGIGAVVSLEWFGRAPTQSPAVQLALAPAPLAGGGIGLLLAAAW